MCWAGEELLEQLALLLDCSLCLTSSELGS